MQKRKPSKIESRLFIILGYYEIHAGAYMRRKCKAHDTITAEVGRMAEKYRPESASIFSSRRQAEKREQAK